MEYSFGDKLKSLRESRNMTQGELADALNSKFESSYNKGMISKWENEKGEPRMEAARNIADFFNISLDELLGLKKNEDLSIKETGSQYFTRRDELDIARRLENILNDLEGQSALAFDGEPLDETTKELVMAQIEHNLRLAKQMAKKRFTPKKYRDQE